MRALRKIESHHRALLICHAIRHLLDHAPADTSSGDVEAVDILQAAIAPDSTPDFEEPQSPASRLCQIDAIPEVQQRTLSPSRAALPRHGSEQASTAGVLGEIAIDRAVLQKVVRENSVPLVSIVDALLRALVKDDSDSVKREPAVEQMA
jgi:hypothetical protein